MPRYFYNTTDGSRERDLVGTELENDGAAHLAALRLIGEILRDTPEVVSKDHDFRVEITNEKGTLVFTAIASAIYPKG